MVCLLFIEVCMVMLLLSGEALTMSKLQLGMRPLVPATPRVRLLASFEQDVRHAVDIYPSIPLIHGYRDRPAPREPPPGPDPFAIVAKELESVSTYVKKIVANENPVLTMAASHFFEKVMCLKLFGFRN